MFEHLDDAGIVVQQGNVFDLGMEFGRILQTNDHFERSNLVLLKPFIQFNRSTVVGVYFLFN